MIRKGSKVAIVGCSNGQKKTDRAKVLRLAETLSEMGLEPVLSEYLFEGESERSGSGRERAEALMNFYRADEIKAIFDISGGDLANEVLPYLDYASIAENGKLFWGYSDLTTVINAIYARTGQKSVLYQIRNLVRECGAVQKERFFETVFEKKNSLYDFKYEFLQGEQMQGVVVGGNIRCLLKLAGTPYWPPMEGKILLLEAWSGMVPQMSTYLSQLQQLGVFQKIGGILLGTFTMMEEKGCTPAIETLVKEYAGPDLPIAKTGEIGHGADSKAIVIGEKLTFSPTSAAAS